MESKSQDACIGTDEFTYYMYQIFLLHAYTRTHIPHIHTGTFTHTSHTFTYSHTHTHLHTVHSVCVYVCATHASVVGEAV